MPSRAEIVSFNDWPPPAGADPWVPGAVPATGIDLTVADPGHEQDCVPALEMIGFRLVTREPWWYGHRALRTDEPARNLHVFGPESPEPVRHRIFRDWWRGNPAKRDRYAAVNWQAASAANARGEHVMQYNAPQGAGHPRDLPPGVRGRWPARGVRSRIPQGAPPRRALRPGRACCEESPA